MPQVWARLFYRGVGSAGAGAGARSALQASSDAYSQCPLLPHVGQVEKQSKLAEIEQQLAETGSSVRQGKQLLGALAENYGNMVCNAV